jgi:hypothetical protein
VRWKPVRVHASEWIALLFVLSVVGFLRVSGLAIDLDSVPYTVTAMLRSLPLVVGLGLTGRIVLDFASGRPALAGVRELATLQRGIEFLRLWIACWTVSLGYFWLKVCIPFLRSDRFDGALREIDRVLHLGVEPSFAASRGLAAPLGSWLSSGLDVWYAAWLVTVVAGIAVFATSSSPAIRRGVVTSCVLLWATGALVYLAVPALGPALAFPGEWSSGAIPRAVAAQELLGTNYERVLAVAAGRPTAPFSHTLGVAALPSLHVGFHVLFALWIRQDAPRLFSLLILAALATFVGSVATGWHYAIDGYAGAGLAWLCYRAARLIEPSATTSP